MSECSIKRTASTQWFLKNKCMPVPYNDWVDITPYIESDVDSSYSNETIDGIKSNSQVNEVYTITYGRDTTFSFKLKVGTFIAEYFTALEIYKETIDVNIENTFELKEVTPLKEYYYPSVNGQLNNPPLKNIESKEYMVEFIVHPNSKPQVADNPNYTPVGANPQNTDINLILAYNADTVNLDFTWTPSPAGINNSVYTYEVYDELGTNKLESGFINDTLTVPFTTTSGLFANTSGYLVKIFANELGYGGHVIEIGSASITPTP